MICDPRNFSFSLKFFYSFYIEEFLFFFCSGIDRCLKETFRGIQQNVQTPYYSLFTWAVTWVQYLFYLYSVIQCDFSYSLALNRTFATKGREQVCLVWNVSIYPTWCRYITTAYHNSQVNCSTGERNHWPWFTTCDLLIAECFFGWTTSYTNKVQLCHFCSLSNPNPQKNHIKQTMNLIICVLGSLSNTCNTKQWRILKLSARLCISL